MIYSCQRHPSQAVGEGESNILPAPTRTEEDYLREVIIHASEFLGVLAVEGPRRGRKGDRPDPPALTSRTRLRRLKRRVVAAL